MHFSLKDVVASFTLVIASASSIANAGDAPTPPTRKEKVCGYIVNKLRALEERGGHYHIIETVLQRSLGSMFQSLPKNFFMYTPSETATLFYSEFERYFEGTRSPLSQFRSDGQKNLHELRYNNSQRFVRSKNSSTSDTEVPKLAAREGEFEIEISAASLALRTIDGKVAHLARGSRVLIKHYYLTGYQRPGERFVDLDADNQVNKAYEDYLSRIAQRHARYLQIQVGLYQLGANPQRLLPIFKKLGGDIATRVAAVARNRNRTAADIDSLDETAQAELLKLGETPEEIAGTEPRRIHGVEAGLIRSYLQFERYRGRWSALFIGKKHKNYWELHYNDLYRTTTIAQLERETELPAERVAPLEFDASQNEREGYVAAASLSLYGAQGKRVKLTKSTRFVIAEGILVRYRAPGQGIVDLTAATPSTESP